VDHPVVHSPPYELIEEAAKVIITFNSMTMSDKILDTLCRTLCDDQQTNPKKIPTEKSIIIL